MKSANPNPHIGNLERAPYMLGKLLLKLGHGDSAEDLTQISEAAKIHASNARDTLLRGLEALGQTMAVAATNEEGDVEPLARMSLGYLVAHIACELQFLGEVDDLTYTASVLADAAKPRSKNKDRDQTVPAQ